MSVGLLLSLKNFLGKYWLHIVIALAAAAVIWHYMDLRSDLRAARAEVVLQTQRANTAWAQVTAQNRAIQQLNEVNQQLTRNVSAVVARNTEERRQLDVLMGNLRGRINQLMNTPSAATPEEQCRNAREELNNVDEINNLLNNR